MHRHETQFVVRHFKRRCEKCGFWTRYVRAEYRFGFGFAPENYCADEDACYERQQENLRRRVEDELSVIALSRAASSVSENKDGQR